MPGIVRFGLLVGLEGRSENMYMPEFMIALCEWLLDSPCLVYGGIGTVGLCMFAYVIIMEVGASLQNSENWD